MKKGHIFVQCASYRDPELRQTVKTALENAEHPNRLAFGICWQGELDELKDHLCLKGINQCRIVLIEKKSARGIGYARHKAQKMVEDEEYTLQIDSHMRFLPGWDQSCINMLGMCPSNKPLLTAYLSDYDGKESPRCYRLGACNFAKNGNLLICGSSTIKGLLRPQPGILCSAHFVFARTELFKQAPPDPLMQFLYEETLIAPRAWTWGWDIYYPHEAPMQHKWNRNYRVTNWSEQNLTALDKECRQHYRKIVGIDPEPYDGKFGLGKIRSLEEYEYFTGINFKNKTLTKQARFGKPTNI